MSCIKCSLISRFFWGKKKQTKNPKTFPHGVDGDVTVDAVFCPLRCVRIDKGTVLFCPVPAFRGWGNVTAGFVLLHSRQTAVTS